MCGIVGKVSVGLCKYVLFSVYTLLQSYLDQF